MIRWFKVGRKHYMQRWHIIYTALSNNQDIASLDALNFSSIYVVMTLFLGGGKENMYLPFKMMHENTGNLPVLQWQFINDIFKTFMQPLLVSLVYLTWKLFSNFNEVIVKFIGQQRLWQLQVKFERGNKSKILNLFRYCYFCVSNVKLFVSYICLF